MSAAALLLDKTRLHLQHGPIDLIVMAEGTGDARTRAFDAAAHRFETILSVLVDELDFLRMPVDDQSPDPMGPVARRMMAACRPHSAEFVTPMAAVAGSVADEVLAAMVMETPLARAAVNNGGDIAVHLSEGQKFTVAAFGEGECTIDAASPIRGIATSGRGGRSLSLGIADAVTVTARNAAQADVAATLIANTVDLPGHPAIRRAPANTLRDDSDLGERLAVTGLDSLEEDEARAALANGVRVAERMKYDRLIEGAALFLQGEERII